MIALFFAYLYCIPLFRIFKTYLYCISLLSCCCLLLFGSWVVFWSFWGCVCSMFGRVGWSEGCLGCSFGVLEALGPLYCISLLHIFISYVHCLSLSHISVAYLYCLCLLHIFIAYSCCISILHIYIAYLCCCVVVFCRLSLGVDVWSFGGCLESIFDRFGGSEDV